MDEEKAKKEAILTIDHDGELNHYIMENGKVYCWGCVGEYEFDGGLEAEMKAIKNTLEVYIEDDKRVQEILEDIKERIKAGERTISLLDYLDIY